ncbi:UDP:flavonoid glycosyltransferase YjiC (YdhE family) [Streptomyces sp. SAI-170]|uniref:nucleotide disphospho-sugar-binding domain-containing protein n=1 Tax=Streptomyces sp. SAI-170 TaxID=3377729 RepID=UPI003C7B2FFF
MRVLLVTPSAEDRLHQLVPLAWALRTAGHAVQIAARPAFTEAVTATGLVAVAVGKDVPETEALLDEPADVDGLVAHGRLWRPRLVLWDSAAPAGAAAAAQLGTPHVRVDGPFGPPAQDTDTAPHRVLDCLPPSLRTPGDDSLSVRPVPYTGPKVIPVWLRRTPRVRRVLVTADVPDAAIPALFEAVAGTDAELVCARPADRVPDGVRLPSQVRLFDDIPADAVLPSCAGVVHGGAPALAAAALSHGLPQLVLSDRPAQEGVVERLVRYGAAAVLDPAHLDAAALRDVTGDSALRTRAGQLGAECAALPSPRDLVPELTGLTADR